jgi:PKD repeat protein
VRSKFIIMPVFVAVGFLILVFNLLFASPLETIAVHSSICNVNDSTEYEIFNPLTNTNGTAVHSFLNEDGLTQYVLPTLTSPEDSTLISVGNYMASGYVGDIHIAADYPFTISNISGAGILLVPSFEVTSQTGLMVTFHNTSIGYESLLWDFGDGMTSTVNSPTHVFPSSDMYTTTLTVKRNGCFDRAPNSNPQYQVVLNVIEMGEMVYLPVIISP